MAPVYADHPFKLLHTPTYSLPKDVKPDLFHRLASEMVVLHNIVIRGLNSIYLQAAYIKPEDQHGFANYMVQWFKLIDAHHLGEESMFFPAVDKFSGASGYMDVNIEQHRAFHEGLEEFGKYAKACVAKTEKYDGQKVIAIIDGFGETMVTHLNDEIPTILSMVKFGEEKMAPIEVIFGEEGKQVIGSMGLLDGLPWAISNIDRYYEEKLFFSFPHDPVAQVILFLVRNLTWWVHSDWWKFGACDRDGKMQPLYAIPKE